MMNEGQIHRGRGLVDLIRGVTPTFVDWTVDPTNAANITDGDISTFCDTGNKVTGAGYQYGYFEWDLGAFYNVLCDGVGASAASAGNPYTYVKMFDGANWIVSVRDVGASSVRFYAVVGGVCSKVRLGITADAAATITPTIREFHVWRL